MNRTITALMLARNEDWVLGFSLRVAMQWCDHAYVILHSTNDESGRIIEEVSKDLQPHQRIVVEHIADTAWPEMAIRQHQLTQARREFDSSHYAIIDADEAVTANWVGNIREVAFSVPARQIGTVPMISPWHCLDWRRVDGHFGEGANLGLAFGDHPDLHWANAPDGYCWHSRAPKNATSLQMVSGLHAGGCFHLQYASAYRLRVKSAWYKALEATQFPGRTHPQVLNDKMDWAAVPKQPARLLEVPYAWWDYTHIKTIVDPARNLIDLSREPWQLAHLREMVAANPAHWYRGLNFHGLIETPK